MINPANKEAVGLVLSALAAGDKAAATRNRFSGTEWEKVRMAPLAAVYLIVSASPSGFLGQVKELSAAAEAISQALKCVLPTSLAATAFASSLDRAELEEEGHRGSGFCMISGKRWNLSRRKALPTH